MKKFIYFSIISISVISIFTFTRKEERHKFGMYTISYEYHNEVITFMTTEYSIDAKTKCIEFTDEVGDYHKLCNYKINEW